MQALATEQELIDVVGFGGGDTVEEGTAFVREHGLSFRNLYEEERGSWVDFGVSGQPAWVLYDVDGSELGRGAGAVSEAQLQPLLGKERG